MGPNDPSFAVALQKLLAIHTDDDRRAYLRSLSDDELLFAYVHLGNREVLTDVPSSSLIEDELNRRGLRRH